MILRIRILIILWLIGMCWNRVMATEPIVSFSVRDMPVEQVLLLLEKQTGLQVSFESSLLEQMKPVTLSVKKQTLSVCLYELFQGYDIDWQVTDSYLILKRRRLADYSPKDSIKMVSLQEFVVEADSLRRSFALTNEPGKELLSGNQIRRLPVFMGQPDLIKTLQHLPGVATGTEGLSGMYVRGGNNDENLFLIDGMPVYQINHLGGLFSAFNSDVIDKLDFYKGFFPARYEGRLSSVTDIQTKSGNMQSWHGGFNIGLIQGLLNLEGPLVKDKLSVHVSVRRTWADLLAIPTLAIISKINKETHTGRYSFHDINARMDYRHSDRSLWSLSVFSGDDVFSLTNKVNNNYANTKESNHYKVRWGNLAASLNWRYRLSDHFHALLTASYTRYRSKLRYSDEEYSYVDDVYKKNSVFSTMVSGIDDGRITAQLEYTPSSKHRIQGGLSARLQAFRPEYEEINQIEESVPTQIRQKNVQRMLGNETVLFVEDRFTPSEPLRIDAGISLSSFYLDRTWYWSLQPRFSLRYLWNERWSAKLAYSRMHQAVHQLPASYLELPTDIWLPSCSGVKPSVSDHVSTGVYFSPNRDYSFSMEGYFKYIQHLADFKPWVNRYPDGMAWQEKLTEGVGRAYGLEWMARKETGKLTGWIGYTLSWSERKFEAYNMGHYFPSRYDNRHKVNIVASYKFNEKIELNASWFLSSGNWMTIVPESQEDWPYLYRNNYQLPFNHRLDLGLNIYRKKKKGRMGIWNISIYNAYCQRNPTIAWTEWSEGTWVKIRQLSLFPIIPSFSYTYKF